jgi:adenylosuccinate synthase
MARGVPTYFGPEFVVHPMLFFKEYDNFTTLPGVGREFFKYPTLYVNSRCLVTTPWDMLINQCMERSRSTGRHGSVGIGFGETIERCQHPEFKLTVADLWSDRKDLEKKLVHIRDKWIKKRFKKTEFSLNETESSVFFSPNTLNKFLDDCEYFVTYTSVQGNIFLASFDRVVFEGAQGLMLDQDYGPFPYVTRSNTGLKNPMDIIRSIDSLTSISEINVYYVTRAYTTRHGAGPLACEFRMPGCKLYEHIDDKTNIDGEWQGSLRFSYLNLDALKDAISHDINKYADDRAIIRGIMTCCDQIGEHEPVCAIQDGEIICLGQSDKGVNNLIKEFEKIIGRRVVTSYGPTSGHLGIF